MKERGRIFVAVCLDKVGIGAVVVITPDKLAASVHCEGVGVFVADDFGLDAFLPVRPHFYGPVLLFEGETEHFSGHMVEGAEVAFDSPEDTVMIVGVGERDNLDGGELLHIGDAGFVVGVLSVVGFVVLVV